jgi:hypothetical protein
MEKLVNPGLRVNRRSARVFRVMGAVKVNRAGPHHPNGLCRRPSTNLILIPSRLAILRTLSGFRPVFFTMASRFMVLASAISSRSMALEYGSGRFGGVAIQGFAFGSRSRFMTNSMLYDCISAQLSTHRVAGVRYLTGELVTDVEIAGHPDQTIAPNAP